MGSGDCALLVQDARPVLRKTMNELNGTLWVAGGGALGAYCRYQFSAWFALWFGKGFPYGTLFVNVFGSSIMGILVGAILVNRLPSAPWHDFIGEGFLGALTTFSTFSMDTFTAFQEGKPGKAVINIILNMSFCLGGIALGFSLLAG